MLAFAIASSLLRLMRLCSLFLTDFYTSHYYRIGSMIAQLQEAHRFQIRCSNFQPGPTKPPIPPESVN